MRDTGRIFFGSAPGEKNPSRLAWERFLFLAEPEAGAVEGVISVLTDDGPRSNFLMYSSEKGNIGWGETRGREGEVGGSD